MTELNRTEIRFSRASLMMPLLIMMLFLIVSLLFLFAPPELTGEQSEHYSAGFVRLLALIFAFLFFMGAKSIYKQMTRSEPAVIMDSEGITDNTSELSQGFVRWSDIESVSQQKVDSRKLISLHLNEPNDLAETKEVLITMARLATDMIDEYTINIDTHDLAGDFDTLFQQVDHYHKATKGSDHRNKLIA